MVGLTDYEDRDVDSLSGGQQQRVMLARVLISKPRFSFWTNRLSEWIRSPFGSWQRY